MSWAEAALRITGTIFYGVVLVKAIDAIVKITSPVYKHP